MPGHVSSEGVPSSLNTCTISCFPVPARTAAHPLDLVVDVTAGEEGSAGIGELGEDTSGRPHVDTRGVELGTEQHVRGAVPQGHHLGEGEGEGEGERALGHLHTSALSYIPQHCNI